MPRTILLTHPDKLLYPKDQITKQAVFDYYALISDLFLKYSKKHPLTLERYPQGISKPGFFQKHADQLPAWIQKATIQAKQETIDFVLANTRNDLLYLANLNTIIFHSALFSDQKKYYPDMLIWDLDPSVDDFSMVIEVAFKLRKVLDNLGIRSLIKTTGSKGLHIHVPLNGRFPFEVTHAFAQHISEYLVNQYPQLMTIEPYKINRKNRVLIDYKRNFILQTAVAAYSLRALPSAPVATPILWQELGKTVLSARQFNLHNLPERIKKVGDIWQKEKMQNSTIHQVLKLYQKLR